MTLKECYEEFQGDYDGTVARLMTEERIRKYLKEFLNDPDFARLGNGMQENDDRTAFMAAHTLKGLALNLGMSALAQSASDLTEALRYERKPEADELFVRCKADYEMTEHAIEAFLSANAGSAE